MNILFNVFEFMAKQREKQMINPQNLLREMKKKEIVEGYYRSHGEKI